MDPAFFHLIYDFVLIGELTQKVKTSNSVGLASFLFTLFKDRMKQQP